MSKVASFSPEVKQYFMVTGNYWAFTLTDGALRMLVVLHFHDLGYSPIEIAFLFLFYEFFGVVTNLIGGWLGSRIGLNRTLNIGLGLQILALCMLLVPGAMLSVPWVMGSQAISGIAKDLNKMSAKSSIKLLVREQEQSKLYQWVAFLTGSKNSLKGGGFFLGGGLLASIGFNKSVLVMMSCLLFIWLISLVTLKRDLGRAKTKPKFSSIFSKSEAINILSLARLFLFGARDVWFVVALPVYLSTVLGWDHWSVGGFLAGWVICYGAVQAFAPRLTGRRERKLPDGASAVRWALTLSIVSGSIPLAMMTDFPPAFVLPAGLLVYGGVFAVNSSLHSYLIISYADIERASMDVGFYYMANAMGRLIGTILSGWLFQANGLVACLWVSTFFIMVVTVLSSFLPKNIFPGGDSSSQCFSVWRKS